VARLHKMRVSIWSPVFAVLVGVVATGAQDTPLVSGQSKAEPQATVDLAEVGLAGTIGAVRVTIGPGIMTADHTHTGRTSIFVIVQGSLTDVRGSARREYRAGDVVTVAEGVTHHAENHGAVPVVYVELNATANKK
jgi:mannose-6-phosphate isomerase-like protein (cupin superfamily)